MRLAPIGTDVAGERPATAGWKPALALSKYEPEGGGLAPAWEG